ncbi:hypothetical protein F511_03891 [Dorcoceras hygrometricum]|uniref:Uncharacterized protein n=1 Tax=Dorcoceras hygrometricum TaxID=472368 RepID=A0A2Z7AXE5_9LAMI|nr:hypothetical protein F511_03891 [Dorcoceras hygrometricum]
MPHAAADRPSPSPPPPSPGFSRDRTCFDHRDEENPFVLKSCRFPRETGLSQAPRRQQGYTATSAGPGVVSSDFPTVKLHRFKPRGKQFKKSLSSSSSGSDGSSSGSSRAMFDVQFGGIHPSTQWVQGVYNICGYFGHFSIVCPSAGSQRGAPPRQGDRLAEAPLCPAWLPEEHAKANTSLTQNSTTQRQLATGSPLRRRFLLRLECKLPADSCDWMTSSMTSSTLKHLLKLNTTSLLLLRFASSADCDDIKADVITAHSIFSASSHLLNPHLLNTVAPAE